MKSEFKKTMMEVLGFTTFVILIVLLSYNLGLRDAKTDNYVQPMECEITGEYETYNTDGVTKIEFTDSETGNDTLEIWFYDDYAIIVEPNLTYVCTTE
jgi:hypothetical protein